MILCYHDEARGLKLEQETATKHKLFRVTYGKEVRDNLRYDQAAAQLGAFLLHALACEGRLNNSGA